MSSYKHETLKKLKKKSIKVKLCTIFFSGQAKQNWSVDISHWNETSYKNHDEI